MKAGWEREEGKKKHTSRSPPDPQGPLRALRELLSTVPNVNSVSNDKSPNITSPNAEG